MTDMAGAHDCIVFARMGMSEERLVIIASVSVLRDFSWKVQLHEETFHCSIWSLTMLAVVLCLGLES